MEIKQILKSKQQELQRTRERLSRGCNSREEIEALQTLILELSVEINNLTKQINQGITAF